MLDIMTFFILLPTLDWVLKIDKKLTKNYPYKEKKGFPEQYFEKKSLSLWNKWIWKSIICVKMCYINGWMVISNLVISLLPYNLTRKLVIFIFSNGFLWFSLTFFFSFKKMKMLSNWKFQLWFLFFFSSNICMWIAC